MIRWALVAVSLAAGCAGTPGPAPREWVVLEGNLSARHKLLEQSVDDAPVLRVQRDGDTYRVTDLLLHKVVEWNVPYDDPEPRLLRFQHTSITCQAGLLRHGEDTVDLKNGEQCVVRKNGRIEKRE